MSSRAVRIAPIFALAFFAAVGGIVVRSTSARGAASMPTVPPGFTIETIANLDGPRELAVAPNGDLLVGTNGDTVQLVRDATGTPGPPHPFASFHDHKAAGVALGRDALYVGTYGGVWRVPYAVGDVTARAGPVEIAKVRPDGGKGHITTSVALGADVLYAGVGSSCNACDERDPTRATIQEMALDGSHMRSRATHIRNPVALAIDPQTGALWAGVAGQDELEHGHPYEIFDAVGAHPGVPDYGWPTCFEDHRPVDGKRDCGSQQTSRTIFPAYETPIGAAFYDVSETAAHAFPKRYHGGAFVALHGSWHTPPVPPRVVFIPMHGDDPQTPVDWQNPGAQWTAFASGYQHDDGSRIGRPTGIAVARDGTLFVADDEAGAIYRIRPKR